MGTKKHEIYTAASFFSYFYRSRSLVRLISSFNNQSEPERIFAVSVSDFILRFFLQLIIGCGDVIFVHLEGPVGSFGTAVSG